MNVAQRLDLPYAVDARFGTRLVDRKRLDQVRAVVLHRDDEAAVSFDSCRRAMTGSVPCLDAEPTAADGFDRRGVDRSPESQRHSAQQEPQRRSTGYDALDLFRLGD